MDLGGDKVRRKTIERPPPRGVSWVMLRDVLRDGSGSSGADVQMRNVQWRTQKDQKREDEDNIIDRHQSEETIYMINNL